MSRTFKRQIEACANWLAYCLSIGWKKSDLDELERIWWKYHPIDRP